MSWELLLNFLIFCPRALQLLIHEELQGTSIIHVCYFLLEKIWNLVIEAISRNDALLLRFLFLFLVIV